MPIGQEVTEAELRAALAERAGQRPIREQIDRGFKRAKRHGKVRFLTQLEGTGLTVAVLAPAYQWIFPWQPTDALGGVILAVIFGAFINWYNDAHRRAVLEGSEDSDIGNDKQAGKDNLFSFLPLIGIGIVYAVSAFGLVLKYNFHAFDGDEWWVQALEDRVITSWTFVALSTVVIWAVVGDLRANSQLFSRLIRRGGLQVRNEQT